MKANQLTAAALLTVAMGFATTAVAETIEYRCNDSKTTHLIEYSADGKTVTLQSEFGNMAAKGEILKAVPGAKGLLYESDRTDMGKPTLKGESRAMVVVAGGRRVFNCQALAK